VKTCHYTHHTVHYFITDHPRGRMRQGPYPQDLGDSALSTRPRPILDLASTQPRLTIGQQGEKADVAQDSGSFHRLVLYVTMVSRDGWPFPEHVATAISIGIDKTSPQRHPRHPCLLLPYKRAGRGSIRGKGKTNDRQRETSLHPTIERSTSQTTIFVFSTFL
jgi:hypothetical protein